MNEEPLGDNSPAMTQPPKSTPPPESLATDAPKKRPYVTPAITDLGDVRELTKGSGSPNFDGPGKKRAPG